MPRSLPKSELGKAIQTPTQRERASDSVSTHGIRLRIQGTFWCLGSGLRLVSGLECTMEKFWTAYVDRARARWNVSYRTRIGYVKLTGVPSRFTKCNSRYCDLGQASEAPFGGGKYGRLCAASARLVGGASGAAQEQRELHRPPVSLNSPIWTIEFERTRDGLRRLFQNTLDTYPREPRDSGE